MNLTLVVALARYREDALDITGPDGQQVVETEDE
jgi:hypothetical protein